MTAPLAATYSDLKFIRTRKVCQLVLEIPIEQAGQVVDLLGAPNPAEEVWCAVARLDPKAAGSSNGRTPGFDPGNDGSNPSPATKPKSRAQMAGILCNDVRFQRWLKDEFGYCPSMAGAVEASELAADRVRVECGVDSRSELDTNPNAAARWDELYAEYKRECM